MTYDGRSGLSFFLSCSCPFSLFLSFCPFVFLVLVFVLVLRRTGELISFFFYFFFLWFTPSFRLSVTHLLGIVAVVVVGVVVVSAAVSDRRQLFRACAVPRA